MIASGVELGAAQLVRCPHDAVRPSAQDLDRAREPLVQELEEIADAVLHVLVGDAHDQMVVRRKADRGVDLGSALVRGDREHPSEEALHLEVGPEQEAAQLDAAVDRVGCVGADGARHPEAHITRRTGSRDRDLADLRRRNGGNGAAGGGTADCRGRSRRRFRETCDRDADFHGDVSRKRRPADDDLGDVSAETSDLELWASPDISVGHFS
jgi:hypothetical protein